MNKNLIYTVVVLILMVASVFALIKSNKETKKEPDDTTNTEVTEESVTTEEPTPTSTEEVALPSTHEVIYGSLGFVPSTLEIKIGDTVSFKNESGKGMWVASNPHPSHSGTPEFDAGISIANGNSWSFTFTEEGSFGYHNHLNSSQGGKIIVN